MIKDIDDFLERFGIRPTSNRVLVSRTLMEAAAPLSLSELETELETLDKSSIFRVLSLLLAHGAIHAVEDGRGIAKYEICEAEGECHPDHFHAHFYCEKCQRTFCLDNLTVSEPELPEGFTPRSVNYMIKGVCKDCRKE